MDINFGCTKCGKCCHNIKVPLTVKEAIEWLSDGNAVQVICEAVPWPVEPPADDLPAAHKRRRSFATMSGSLPTRVVVILAAMFSGDCPNLNANMRCRIYERRPLVCRIYPAEINPFLDLQPESKECPSQAWNLNQPALLKHGILVDAGMLALIQQYRDTDARDIHTKEKLCAAMHLDATSMANEGYVVHSPDQGVLLNELIQANTEPDRLMFPTNWRFISNQRSTVDTLASVGAFSSLVAGTHELPFEYLGFQPPSA
jgi:Fe-S-cluster containining protein